MGKIGQNTTASACESSYNRCSSKFRHASKKSNITAERVTLLPHFLARSKPGNASNSSSEDVNQPKLRRSWRLCKKNRPVSVSGYFTKLLKEENKSIFKEIKTKYGEKFENDSSCDEDFEEKIFKQLLGNFTVKDTSYYREKILNNIETVNNLLAGIKGNMSGSRKRSYTDDDKENFPMKFPYIPQSKWVFQTPPNRKLNFRGINTDTGIEPAVIETSHNSKIVYEMNKKINVDLSRFHNRQEIDIDNRYMVKLGEPKCMEEMDGEQISPLDFLAPEPFELENHFLSLTCRPKKVTQSVSRVSSNNRRKRDIFEQQPHCSTDSDWKPNCFLETTELNHVEESFTFKFNNNESSGSSTSGHLFDVEGNKTFNFHF